MLGRRRRLLGLLLAALAAAAATLVVGSPAQATTYYWRTMNNYNNGKCVDVRGEDSYHVQQWECVGNDNQRWRFEYYLTNSVGQEYYRIINKRTNKCLSVPGASLNSGVQLVVLPCTIDVSQFWTFRSPASTYTAVVNFYSYICMEVWGGSSGNGAVVQQNSCNGTGAQLFALH